MIDLRRFRPFLLCFAGFAFIAILLGYHSFFNLKSTAYPWWYEQGNDGDGINVTQSLALLNNADLLCVTQPAGTLYGIHGSFYRALCVAHQPYCALMHLDNVSQLPDAFALLDLAMRASRVLTYCIYLFLFIIFWIMLFYLVQNGCMAFFLSAFFMTAPTMIEKLHIIRSELISFVFCALILMVVLVYTYQWKKSLPREIAAGLLIGICGALAIFTKILVLPEIFILFLIWSLWQKNSRETITSNKIPALAIGVSLLNFLIMPWHWLKRPALLTDAYLEKFYPGGDDIRVYGPVPQTLAPLILPILAVLLGMALIAFFKSRVWPKFLLMTLRMNVITCGMILGCYLVFAGLGMNRPSYHAASNHLLYSTITNVLYGAFLQNKVVMATILNPIWGAHGKCNLLGINILQYVSFAAAASVLRILWPKTSNKLSYGAVVFFFVLGGFMDTVSSMRWKGNYILSSYTIYSLSCYILGLGLWLGNECRRLRGWRGQSVCMIVCLALAYHLISQTIFFINLPKASGIAAEQNPKQEMLNTLSHVRSFWDLVSHGQL